MRAMQTWIVGTLIGAAAAMGAAAQTEIDANLADMYGALEHDPLDVTTRLRLAGYLQSVGLVEEGNAVLRELAAMGGDVDLLDERSSGGCDGCPPGPLGGDLIVGDINGITNWGKFEKTPGEWHYAFSAGTTNCNIGTERLEWFNTINRHPVVGQNIYRIHNGELRQLGQSWLKHLFFALSQQLCALGCQSTNGYFLGVNCSDPYTSGRAGQQSNLGPRHQIRASSGYYPYPPAQGTGTQNLLSRRIQVRLTDLNPLINPGAIYFVVTKGVQWQDSQAENDNNNESWRRFGFNYNDGGTPTDLSDDVVSTPTFFVNGQTQTTQRMKTPIDAWQHYVPAVQTADIIVPHDSNFELDGAQGETYYSGRMQIGSSVVDNGDGTWTYRYAIFNQNCDRSARSFSMPVQSTVTVSEPGFADVDYHSGDGVGNVTFDGTDWAFALERGVGRLSWATQTFDENENANALRWATTYTFRFTADAPPAMVPASIGLFRPGIDPDPVVMVQGPRCALVWDIDGDGAVGFADLNIVLSDFGGVYGFEDLNALLGQWHVTCH